MATDAVPLFLATEGQQLHNEAEMTIQQGALYRTLMGGQSTLLVCVCVCVYMCAYVGGGGWGGRVGVCTHGSMSWYKWVGVCGGGGVWVGVVSGYAVFPLKGGTRA